MKFNMRFKPRKNNKNGAKKNNKWQTANRWKKISILLLVIGMTASAGSYYLGTSHASGSTFWRKYWNGDYVACSKAKYEGIENGVSGNCVWGSKEGAWFWAGDVRGATACGPYGSYCGPCWGTLVYPRAGIYAFVPEGYMSNYVPC
jgi:hypothetical protein